MCTHTSRLKGEQSDLLHRSNPRCALCCVSWCLTVFVVCVSDRRLQIAIVSQIGSNQEKKTSDIHHSHCLDSSLTVRTIRDEFEREAVYSAVEL